MTRVQGTFLALVTVQAAHSAEEYFGRLYEAFAPARLVSGLVSQDLQRGFLIFNVALVAFGFWCFFWPVRRHWRSATGLMGFWVAIELVNGIGHPLWTLFEGRYTPGVGAASVLLVLSVWLASQLSNSKGRATA